MSFHTDAHYVVSHHRDFVLEIRNGSCCTSRVQRFAEATPHHGRANTLFSRGARSGTARGNDCQQGATLTGTLKGFFAFLAPVLSSLLGPRLHASRGKRMEQTEQR